MRKIELEVGPVLANLLGAWSMIGVLIYGIEKIT